MDYMDYYKKQIQYYTDKIIEEKDKEINLLKETISGLQELPKVKEFKPYILSAIGISRIANWNGDKKLTNFVINVSWDKAVSLKELTDTNSLPLYNGRKEKVLDILKNIKELDDVTCKENLEIDESNRKVKEFFVKSFKLANIDTTEPKKTKAKFNSDRVTSDWFEGLASKIPVGMGLKCENKYKSLTHEIHSIYDTLDSYKAIEKLEEDRIKLENVKIATNIETCLFLGLPTDTNIFDILNYIRNTYSEIGDYYRKWYNEEYGFDGYFYEYNWWKENGEYSDKLTELYVKILELNQL